MRCKVNVIVDMKREMNLWRCVGRELDKGVNEKGKAEKAVVIGTRQEGAGKKLKCSQKFKRWEVRKGCAGTC